MSKVGMFRYYNMILSAHGEIFGLCQAHESKDIEQPPPVVRNGVCVLQKVAADGNLPCNKCEGEAEQAIATTDDQRKV